VMIPVLRLAIRGAAVPVRSWLGPFLVSVAGDAQSCSPIECVDPASFFGPQSRTEN
jgi:hypothetical protein